MKLLSTLLFIFWSTIGWSIDYSSSELQHLEGEYREQLNTNLKKYLSDIEFNAFIQIHADLITKESFKAELSKSNEQYLSGYLPIPIEQERHPIYEEKRYTVKKIDLQIHLYQKIPPAALNTIKEIAKRTVGKFSPVIEVKQIDKELQKPTPPSLLKESFFDKNMGQLIELFGKILLGFLAILATMIFSSSFKAPLGSMADTMKNFSFVKTSSSGGESTSRKEEKPSPEALPQSHDRELFAKNLEIFKSILSDSPHILGGVLERDVIGFLGLKSLIVHLDDEAHKERLKRLIPQRTLIQLSQTKTKDIFVTELSFITWFNELTENLILATITNDNEFIKNIDHEILKIFYSSPQERLLSYLKESPSPTAQKLISNFLSETNRAYLLKSFSATELTSFLEEKDIDLNEIKKEGLLFKAYIEQMASPKTEAISAEIAKENIILPSLLSFFKNSPYKETDPIMRNLLSTRPDLISQIIKEVWTPSQLNITPLKVLNEELMSFSSADRIRIISPLTEESRKRILSSIPEGKGKEILLDTLKTSTENSDETTLREYLEQIRVKFLLKKFSLEETSKPTASLKEADAA